MAVTQWNATQFIRQYGPIVARKTGFIAVAWIGIYFLSQRCRVDGSVMMLFGLPLGALAGLVAGWYMAENSVDDSNLNGLALWVILVIGAVAPMWLIEAILRMFTHWPMNFGGFMLLTAASLMAMAAAVWHASSQE